MGGALVLALLRIEGRSLPVILQNFFSYFLSSRIYLWKRKTVPPVFVQKVKAEPEKEEKAPAPKIAGRSRLKNLSTQIEIKTR